LVDGAATSRRPGSRQAAGGGALPYRGAGAGTLRGRSQAARRPAADGQGPATPTMLCCSLQQRRNRKAQADQQLLASRTADQRHTAAAGQTKAST